MRTAFAALALLLTLSACASVEEAYGRPDPFEWSYFEGSAEDVVNAIDQTFQQSGIRVESIYTQEDGVIVTVAGRTNSARFSQIRVQRTDVETFTARAQIYPEGDPLPRWLETEISGRI